MATSTISQYITVGVYPGKGTYGANLSVTSLGTINTADKFAVSFSASGYLSNDGLIKSTGNYGVGLSSSGGTITNAGLASSIYGTIDGIDNKSSKTGSSITVANAGTITGNDQYGIKLSETGNITNIGADSLIIGGQGGISDSSGALTVTNQGAIKGVQDDGIRLNGGGTVTNFGTQSYIYGGADGVYASKTAVITNAGTIICDVYGVYLRAGGTITNTGASALISATYSAVGMGKAGTVVNDGTLTGQKNFGVYLEEGGVINNAGTISGGRDAIYVMSGKFTLEVEAGAVFAGNVLDEAGGGTLVLGGTAAGSIAIDDAGSSFTGFSSINFAAGSSWTLKGNVGGLASGQKITGFAVGDTIDLTGIGLVTAETFANGVLTLTSGSNTYTLDIETPGPSGTADFALSSDGNGGTDVVVCFAAGTQIGTPDGEVPVEQLQIGDRVLTARNGPRPVKWIGQGKVLATRGKRSAATPVIVRKGALADNVPNRDLRVTKAHSLYIDDVLIPVEFLVNYRTILWDDRAQEVAIYHVELDSHDVLIANGAPAESYRDDGNRWLFHNANAGWHLPPQEPYVPVLTGGPVVDAAWRRFLDRVRPRDLPPLTEDPDLHLVIDGARVDPEYRRGSLYGFRLPSSPKSVVIASRVGVPSELGIARDPRSLGVALRQVAVRQGGKFMLFDADDDRLMAGFHAYEADCNLRWTDGCATLPAAAFARFDKGAEVMLHLGGTTQYPDERASPARAAA
ncbi:MAG: Hint domain-containing protein [Rhodopila sp.]|nr:Hint domain-containing protein [Rhodopila sp.]